jgi:iron complex outermembrane receptor protein
VSSALQTASNIAGVRSGNRDLRAETARTWTAGVVLRPSFLPGLTASVDWYDINLRGAINTANPSDLATLCVDQPTIDNQFCSSITRAQGTGIINGYTVQPQNVARFRTAGADLNIDYLVRTASLGVFDLRLVGGYLNRLEFIGTPGALPTNNVDLAGRPKYNATFSPSWTIGALTLTYNLRWQDGVRTVDRLITESDPNYAPARQLRYRELWQHDAQIAYDASEQFSVYLGALNISNQRPDPGNSINQPISALGRYVYVGVKVRTGRS